LHHSVACRRIRQSYMSNTRKVCLPCIVIKEFTVFGMHILQYNEVGAMKERTLAEWCSRAVLLLVNV
jgi:hypothetical protein